LFPVLPGFSGLFILIAPSVFSNVYLIITVFVLYWSVFDYEYKPLIRKFHDQTALSTQFFQRTDVYRSLVFQEFPKR
jgi:hypothetical protein